MKYEIDKYGFLRRSGKIISWSVRDFLWSLRSPKPAKIVGGYQGIEIENGNANPPSGGTSGKK